MIRLLIVWYAVIKIPGYKNSSLFQGTAFCAFLSIRLKAVISLENNYGCLVTCGQYYKAFNLVNYDPLDQHKSLE